MPSIARCRKLAAFEAIEHLVGMQAQEPEVEVALANAVCKVLSHTVAFLLNHQMGNQPLQLSKLLVR